MKEESLQRIRTATEDLPSRWREILEKALLNGEFRNEAERLLRSSLAIHENHPPGMEPAEAILAGDAFIPMAVAVLVEERVPLEDIRTILLEAAAALPG